MATRLTAYKERDYADLMDMAQHVGKDVEILNGQRAKQNNSNGGRQNKSSSGGGSSRIRVNKASFKKNFGGPRSQGN